MSFPPPILDDKDAAALLADAKEALVQRGGAWRGEDIADPGLMLLEAFSHVTAQELKRLNQIPQAAHFSFLSLLGARLRAGSAEATDLTFTLAKERRADTLIPAGMRVSADRFQDVVFTTLEPGVISAGEKSIQVPAARVTRVIHALIGHGTGAAGQKLDLPHRPLPGAPQAVAVVVVLVEQNQTRAPSGATIVDIDKKAFVKFEEVSRIGPNNGDAVFDIDRVTGVLSFPLTGRYIPPVGAEIRVSFNWTQDNPVTTIAADTLVELLTPVPGSPGVSVTNQAAVLTGQEPESVDQAIGRGAISSLAASSAVKARDYEAFALEAHPTVARAHAAAHSEKWLFARPGSVEVLLGLRVTPDEDGAVMPETVIKVDRENREQILKAVGKVMDNVRPLGVTVLVNWLRMKAVGVGARVYVAVDADKEAITKAVSRRLNHLLCPVPCEIWPGGWPLGRAVRQSEVIETIAATPGVRAVDRVVLRPRDPMVGWVDVVAPDSEQGGVWYAVVGGKLYRSLDSGNGWTVALDAPPAVVTAATHDVRTSLVAAATEDGVIHVSKDCGQTFQPFAKAAVAPSSMIWSDGSELPRLLLAGASPLAESGGPVEVGNIPETKELLAMDGLVGPTYAVATLADGRGGRLVAAARRALGGIVLSNDSGWDGGFEDIGLVNEDVRALTFVKIEETVWLIAGCARPVVSTSDVCYIARVDSDMGTLVPQEATNGETPVMWKPASTDWIAGGIAALAARGNTVFAGTRSHGLMVGTLEDGDIRWQLPAADSGLPANETGEGRAPITTVVTGSKENDAIMIGGDGLLYISTNNGMSFRDVTDRHGVDRVTIPEDWTICADAHVIEVEDDTR